MSSGVSGREEKDLRMPVLDTTEVMRRFNKAFLEHDRAARTDRTSKTNEKGP
jgi:hypothetical protein